MAKKVIQAVDEKIPSIETAWDIDETHSYKGTRVEEFIKGELRGKVGYQVIPSTKQDDGFYHVWGFYSKESYDKYMEDKQANASLLLFDNTIPISTDKGVTYSARLYTSAKLNSPVVVIEKKHEVGLRFCGILSENSEIQNAGIMGTLTFQLSTNGGATWSTVGTENIVSRDTTDETYDTVDIGKYFTDINPQQIRVRASFSVHDDEGNIVATAQSAWLTWTNITYTQLSVQNMQDWSRPIMAEDGFPMSFAVSGEVDKYLHVSISGTTGTYTYVEMIPAATQYPSTTPKTWTEVEKSNIGILTHGVHSVTAWLTCDDGSGHLGSDGYPDAIKSETIINRFMVVNTATEGADLTKRYLILQQVQTNVVNYVRTVLTSFAVWIPSEDPTIASGETMEIAIRLTDASENSEGTDYTTEYLASNMQVKSLTKYDVDGTVEIESTTSSTQITEYLSYLRFFRYADDGSYVNFLYESIRQKFVTITVDNKENYSPTAGAYLIINPKTRNNSEKDKFRIYNQVTGEEIPSTWEGFGGVNDTWTLDSDGQRVLRVLAGEKLTIGTEPFESFRTDAKAKLTLDIIFAVRNITAEDKPAIDICQEIGDEIYGMRLRPLEGMVGCAGKQAENDQNFAWEEGKKVHLTLTINPELIAKADDELTWMELPDDKQSLPLALAKVYLNGKPEREVDYTPATDTWITGDGYGGIKIGNANADIDIYGIRAYRTALSAEAAGQNVVASRTTAEEKYNYKTRNDIMTNGRVSVSKCRTRGYRTLTLVGQDQYKLNQDKKGYPCYWEIHHDIEALSGTIGKASYLADINGTIGSKKCLLVTPQGSTANTYWDNNEQTKVDGITFVVNILFSKLHSDFGWKASMSTGEGCSNPLYLDGSVIDYTAYEVLSDEEKSRVRIDVLDGWFDGNGWSSVDAECGMYHGQFYTVEVGGAHCTKLVNKINYASPMQSHKCGATRLYNDVMKSVTGGTGVMRVNPAVRFSVLETPFIFFTSHPNDNGKVEFRGMCTFGDGKFDKTVFGYNTDKRTFGFEGLNNNLPLCDFRVPADEKVTYNPKDEAWVYNGTKSFEYGLGATVKDSDGNKIPTAVNEAMFRKYVNFIYSHNIRMRHYNGTKDKFMSEWENMLSNIADSDVSKIVADMQKYQYWFTQGTSAFCLVRYDFTADTWVDAGTWNDSTETYSAGVRNLSTYYMTSEAYTAWKEGADYGDFSVLGTMFTAAICEHFKANAGKVMHVVNHQTHYNLVNFFLAGTDNCSKNTYYQYDPETGVIWLDQDDLDTILCTDNNGRQTKLYFVDRIHDTEDYLNGYKPQTDYEGKASALFDLIEAAYETNGTELRSNMRSVLTAMTSLVGANESYGVSVWGCIHKYFFSTQEYFPEIAFAEQARLRYEFPKSFGYKSSGNQSRGIDPITQQVGSCLERERQYMRRRIALACSYAAWGDFSSGVVMGVTGLGDSGSSLSLSPGSGRVGSDYTFNVVPNQWLYPTGAKDRAVVDPHARVAPGETYTFNVAKAGDISGDSSVSLAALNYYRKIGNIGNMTVGNNALSISGSRLTELVIEPSGTSDFSPKTIEVSTPNLQTLSMKGCATQTGSRDFSSLIRLESMDISGTGITVAKLPESSLLHTIKLPATITTFTVKNLPSLSTLTFDGFDALTDLSIDESPKINTKVLVSNIFNSAKRSLRSLSVRSVKWTEVSAAMLTWMMTLTSCSIDGTIATIASDEVPYDTVIALIDRFGDIQSEDNSLYVVYRKIPINSINVGGAKYIRETGLWTGWTLNRTPLRGNNIAVKDGKPAIKWSITGEGFDEFAEIVDDTKGYVNVKKVERTAYPTKFTLNVTMTLTDGSQVSYDKTVGFAQRVPRLNDFAYADGTFDNEYDEGLELVGVVIARIVTKYVEGTTTPSQMQIVVYSKENVLVTSTDKLYSSSSLPWGLFPDSANSSGFSSDIGSEINAATGLADSFDTALPNIARSGIVSPTDSSNTNHNNIGDTFIDDSTEDGYAVFASGTAAADLNSDGNTGEIVEHANKIINLYLGESLPTSLTELADAMQRLVRKMEEAGASNATRYRQMYYPMAYACKLYEPEVKGTLADCYKKGKWSAPSAGTLFRIYNFFYNSCGRVTYDKGGRIDTIYANDTPTTEARTPLFANVLKRMGGSSPKFTMPSSSFYWSSTESNRTVAWGVYFSSGGVHNNTKNNQNVTRAVAAFTYDV